MKSFEIDLITFDRLGDNRKMIEIELARFYEVQFEASK